MVYGDVRSIFDSSGGSLSTAGSAIDYSNSYASAYYQDYTVHFNFPLIGSKSRIFAFNSYPFFSFSEFHSLGEPQPELRSSKLRGTVDLLLHFEAVYHATADYLYGEPPERPKRWYFFAN